MVRKPLTAWLFVLPALLVFTALVIAPILWSLSLSLVRWNGLGKQVFVGFGNYLQMLRDKVFVEAFFNTLFFSIVGSVVQLLAGMAMDENGAKMAALTPDAKQAVMTSRDTTETGQAVEVGGRDVDVERETDAKMASATDFDSSYDQTFHAAAASIRQAWQANPDITQISENLIVEPTRDGLNIVISDQQGRRMFPEGSKYPTEQARAAIAAIAPTLARLSNQIEISGHTAAGAVYTDPRYGPWELSSDRANVVRGLLGEFGLAQGRVRAVLAQADVPQRPLPVGQRADRDHRAQRIPTRAA